MSKSIHLHFLLFDSVNQRKLPPFISEWNLDDARVLRVGDVVTFDLPDRWWGKPKDFKGEAGEYEVEITRIQKFVDDMFGGQHAGVDRMTVQGTVVHFKRAAFF